MIVTILHYIFKYYLKIWLSSKSKEENEKARILMRSRAIPKSHKSSFLLNCDKLCQAIEINKELYATLVYA